MDLPKKINAQVSAISVLTPKTAKLDFSYTDNFELNFKPGQFYSMKVGDNTYRSYSICSDSNNTKGFSLVIDVAHAGVGSKFIKALKIGDLVEFVGPAGRYSLKYPLPQLIYFFATGTGIAPFISMFYKLREQDYTGCIKLLFGIRRETEMLFEEQLGEFSKTFNDFDYEVFISQPESSNFKGTEGRVTQKADEVVLEGSHFYLCGNPNMVGDVKKTLLERGASKSQIFEEGFTVSK